MAKHNYAILAVAELPPSQVNQVNLKSGRPNATQQCCCGRKISLSCIVILISAIVGNNIICKANV